MGIYTFLRLPFGCLFVRLPTCSVFYRTNSVIFSSCSEKMFPMRIEKDTMLFHKDCLVKLYDIDVSV